MSGGKRSPSIAPCSCSEEAEPERGSGRERVTGSTRPPQLLRGEKDANTRKVLTTASSALCTAHRVKLGRIWEAPGSWRLSSGSWERCREGRGEEQSGGKDAVFQTASSVSLLRPPSPPLSHTHTDSFCLICCVYFFYTRVYTFHRLACLFRSFNPLCLRDTLSV